MPGFDTIIDQKNAIQLLARLYQRNRIPHALLFSGIDGIGKGEVARRFAQTCNCQNSNAFEPTPERPAISRTMPCRTCRSCSKIAADSHPDIIHVKPSGQYIKISQIRELRSRLDLKPNEARVRVVTLHNAQALNLEAGNAILKILEEPPDKTVFILTASHASDLLPTIRSRCQQIRFRPMRHEQIEYFLTHQKQLPAAEAAVLAGYAQGSPLKAEALADGQWIEKRNLVVEKLGLSSNQDSRPSPMGPLLALAEEFSKDRYSAECFILIIEFWLRDLILCKYSPDRILNTDRKSDLVDTSASIAENKVLTMMKAVETTFAGLKANANTRLRLELLMLHLAGHTSNNAVTQRKRS